MRHSLQRRPLAQTGHERARSPPRPHHQHSTVLHDWFAAVYTLDSVLMAVYSGTVVAARAGDTDVLTCEVQKAVAALWPHIRAFSAAVRPEMAPITRLADKFGLRGGRFPRCCDVGGEA